MKYDLESLEKIEYARKFLNKPGKRQHTDDELLEIYEVLDVIANYALLDFYKDKDKEAADLFRKKIQDRQ